MGIYTSVEDIRADLNDKGAIIALMGIHSPIENQRLDGTEAFCAAYDIFLRSYKPSRDSEAETKPFIKQHGTAEFMKIKNLKAMCWAFDFLRENFSDLLDEPAKKNTTKKTD